MCLTVAAEKKIFTAKVGFNSYPQSLDEVFSQSGEDRYAIDSLIVIGRLTEKDFAVMSSCCQQGHLTGIDMSMCWMPNGCIPSKAFSPSKVNAVASKETTYQGYRTNLRYITLPHRLDSICEEAFSLTNLQSITIERYTSKIDGTAFWGCDSLKTVVIRNMEALPKTGIAFINLSSQVKFLIPQGSLSNYQNAEYWKAIKNLSESNDAYFIKTVHLDGPSLYDVLGTDNYRIDSLIVTGTIKSEDLRAISLNCYKGYLSGINLENASLGKNEYLNSLILYGTDLVDRDKTGKFTCPNLWYYTLPKDLKQISTGTFQYLGIKHIEIPKSVKKISRAAFYRCRNLRGDITIPDGPTQIYSSTFEGSYRIQSIHVPNSVDTLGRMALSKYEHYYHMEGLEITPCDIYINKMTPPKYNEEEEAQIWGFFVYENELEEGWLKGWKLYVPVGAKQNYENAEYWKDIPEIIETAELTGSSTDIQAVKNISDNGLTEVYTLSGRLISKGKEMPRLTKGLYIVKSAGTTRKVQISE